MDVWCDSSYSERDRIAGIGIYIQDGVKQRAISNWIPAENNNFGEMWGVYLSAILMNGKQGTIHTDSQTALAYINQNVKDKPRTQEQYIRHKQLELMGYKIRHALPKGVVIIKTKGHNHKYTNEATGNELSDVLARSGRTKYFEK